VVLTASFEDADTAVAYFGSFSRVDGSDVVDGLSQAQLQGVGASGGINTVVPALVNSEVVAVGFFLRGGTGGGQLSVQISTDLGQTYLPSFDAPPSLTVGRDALWSYSEMRFALPAVPAKVWVRLQADNLQHGGFTGATYLDIDRLQVIDLASCGAAEAVPACNLLGGAPFWSNSFEASDAAVAVSGQWERICGETNAEDGTCDAALVTGEGALTFSQPLVPGRDQIRLGIWTRHGRGPSILNFALSTDGVTFGTPVPVDHDLDMDAGGWTYLETTLPVARGVEHQLRITLTGAWGDYAAPIMLDDVTATDVGPCPNEGAGALAR